MALIVSSRRYGTMPLLGPRVLAGEYEPPRGALTCDNSPATSAKRDDVEEAAGDLPVAMAGGAKVVALRIRDRGEGCPG